VVIGQRKLAYLHIEAMDLILKSALEEQRRDVNMKADETADKVCKDLESAIEVMDSIISKQSVTKILETGSDLTSSPRAHFS
jgi:hypothetical protein